jgi:dihydrofolate reductase
MKSHFFLLAAMDQQRALGLDGDLLVKLPDDLKRFKQLTLHSSVLMGRKTYESIGHALPHRQNIVLTRQAGFIAPACVTVSSLEEAFAVCEHEKLFVIGGADIYRLCMPLCHTLYITQIHHTFERADTFFPEINKDEWKLVSDEYHPADEEHPYAFSFKTFLRDGC